MRGRANFAPRFINDDKVRRAKGSLRSSVSCAYEAKRRPGLGRNQATRSRSASRRAPRNPHVPNSRPTRLTSTGRAVRDHRSWGNSSKQQRHVVAPHHTQVTHHTARPQPPSSFARYTFPNPAACPSALGTVRQLPNRPFFARAGAPPPLCARERSERLSYAIFAILRGYFRSHSTVLSPSPPLPLSSPSPPPPSLLLPLSPLPLRRVGGARGRRDVSNIGRAKATYRACAATRRHPAL
ncbi:uncharacterized protein SCHCODRAFT_02176115 [Schizophyllum commune H4-8]|uniref:uncharacterized protein n=1 Tax=Schizophyllum commune (strain H4-8 / FGSC 9210) TaxID=578458 RepID=UPI00215E7096|nr:uncharacterized protein SCHCODRAFT_02176115 [Schizophyllum commune H4-8]KAI5898874.1 hypothetical protein SCHCODRAFT_02176115 [Schizophyllum commune H4-8]